MLDRKSSLAGTCPIFFKRDLFPKISPKLSGAFTCGQEVVGRPYRLDISTISVAH